MVNKFLGLAVTFYRLFLSHYFGGHCRFEPTCSVYAQECLQTYSTTTSLRLIGRRISKCHPLGPFGLDPVPANDKEIIP